ncbi:MAG: flagellar basal body L-ring protein FlgH [Hyphomicrobiales bacterium]|nr:flagellar basal body L-ring protein FlgH [Hyphomicrobiales bacterium]
MKRIVLLFVCALAGCAADVRDIGVAPHMTAVGAGLSSAAEIPPTVAAPAAPIDSAGSLWGPGAGFLFRDARAAQVGDLITVTIAINDSAQLGNSSNRSRESKMTNAFDAAVSLPSRSAKANGSANVDALSSTTGQGAIDRSEKIQLSVAAVVTQVLPNGNLLISGSQEVRVNFELRELTVTGIVRPRDVSRDNTVSYDKIAEARISYGGRGRMTEVQQPSLIHQVIDLIKPF